MSPVLFGALLVCALIWTACLVVSISDRKFESLVERYVAMDPDDPDRAELLAQIERLI